MVVAESGGLRSYQMCVTFSLTVFLGKFLLRTIASFKYHLPNDAYHLAVVPHPLYHDCFGHQMRTEDTKG